MTHSGWTSVRVRGGADRAGVTRALFALGAEGVQELDDGVITHLRDPDDRAVRSAVTAADPDAHVELAPTPDVDWSAEWKSRIGAHALGALVVAPPWRAAEFPPDACIVIEPEMAFGTGEHETTRGVIRLMQSFIRRGDRVADLGTGSAVLSIAAARLGAAWVAAVELDPDAIHNAEENVARNGVADRVTIVEGDAQLLLPLLAPVRVVLANILSSVLVPLLPVIAGALADDGVAVLSGILLDERDMMLEHIAAAGWAVRGEDREGQWWTVAIARA